jgi:hypothetical protein
MFPVRLLARLLRPPGSVQLHTQARGKEGEIAVKRYVPKPKAHPGGLIHRKMR